ncbi:DNA methyltransferase [Mycobacterium phage Baka]|uniref:Uncharacterized protein n=2 Tax=Omegavirus baka TaxID=1034099 RepID=G1D042_9CAUD|nr:DNA methyltransferase [Mycobacterium phage Minerva]YP_009636255.1 DNA methyltransferase [Mycobacterium phage Baka]AEK08141.1 hypothetical protein PBI_BAKA_84 [Mycobacterium phage Baka]AIK69291.1 hypothetical protein PBI_MINERVA_82 [Mycobacterium phage Minerva]
MMSDRILGTIAKALADDEDVTALDYDEARNILAAFEANRIALVELPEPEEREEDEVAVGWPSVALHRVLVWDDYPGEVHFDYDLEPEEPMSPGEARELAAALLAAAVVAEGEA